MPSPFLTRCLEGAKRLIQPIMPLVRAVNLWLDADGLRMSAAMSFYGMLSLAPLLLLLVGVLGVV
ncbi:YihY/virulence factor BrkB family protein, partial [Acidovorax cattleyae]|nr:YihY/virulence factor BrkB family protein [Paracidovorax cattleyae]